MTPLKTDNRILNFAAGIAAGTVARRKPDGSFECICDEVAVEEPLEIRIDGKPVAITMRTPGHDEELAAGFLLAEGVIRARDELKQVSCAAANVVEISGPQPPSREAQRFGTISSSCGLCGKPNMAAIRQQFPSLPPLEPASLPLSTLLRLPDQLREAQGNFARTGGIHAAGLFTTTGKLLVLREDVGRHNAVDKAVGFALLNDLLPLHQHLLVVSGRTSLEIVQKGLAAGVPIVAAVSAPSTLAISFARDVGMTLIGFLRPPTFNLYSHVERLDVGSY